MHSIEKINCPNCGTFAQRHHLSGLDGAEFGCPEGKAVRVECDSCDYFMTTCELNGSVVEAYSPGVYTLESHWLLRQEPARTWESVPARPARRNAIAASAR